MEKYLDNPICNFTPLFKIDYEIKKNIIACCFFKRENYYKNFLRYVNGIQALYNTVSKYYKDYSVRLFIDNSIYTDKQIMSRLNNLPKLEMVLYDCPMFKSNNNYHIGLFGTIIRFFPMFDFPNNDAKIVILSDIDDHAFGKYRQLFNILKSRADDLYLIKFSNAGRMYNNKKLFNHTCQDFILDYIKPQEMVCLKQIDNNVIINFLKNLDSKVVYSSYFNEDLIKDDKYISKFENNGHFIYGIDEYFLNMHYVKYIVEKKLPFVERFNFNIFNPYYYQMIVRNEHWLHKDKLVYESLLDKILKYLKIKSDKSLDEKFNIILGIKDNIENQNLKRSNLINDKRANEILIIENKSSDLKYKLYKLFIKIKDKKKYNFLFNTIYNNILLSDKYIGIYEFTEMKFYNTKTKDFFIKELKFDDDKIKELKELNKKIFS